MAYKRVGPGMWKGPDGKVIKSVQNPDRMKAGHPRQSNAGQPTDPSVGTPQGPNTGLVNPNANPAGGDPAYTNAGQINLNNLPTLAGVNDLQGFANQAGQANYDFITKNYGQQQQQETDAAKQDLEERGIPYNSDPNSLWGRRMSQIDQKYQNMRDSAMNQALSTSNQTMQTMGNVSQGNYGEMLKGFMANSDAQLKALGLSEDQITKIKQIAAQKAIAAGNNAATTGSASIGANAQVTSANIYANAPNRQSTPGYAP